MRRLWITKLDGDPLVILDSLPLADDVERMAILLGKGAGQCDLDPKEPVEFHGRMVERGWAFYIWRVVAEAPPLSSEQAHRVATLLGPVVRRE